MIDALLRTLAVEAAVHHLDLEPVLPDTPGPSVLAEVRRVLDGLLGECSPSAMGRRSLHPGRHRPIAHEGRRACCNRALADRFPLSG
jgi:hypothetical protein